MSNFGILVALRKIGRSFVVTSGLLAIAASALTVYFVFNWPVDLIDKLVVVEFVGFIYVSSAAIFVMGFLVRAVSSSLKSVIDYLATSLLPPVDQAMQREVEEFRKFQSKKTGEDSEDPREKNGEGR